MIKEFIKSYNESKLLLVKKFSESENGILDETGFLDDGYISTMIDRLKKEDKILCRDLEIACMTNEEDEYAKNKAVELVNRRNQLNFEFAFLTSNSFSNIDFCIDLTKDIDTDFKQCLMALKAYEENRFADAIEMFNNYFSKRRSLLEHYLINKTYGKLLYNIKQYEAASTFLRKAVEKRPEDTELHIMLKSTYEALGDTKGKSIEENIINILGE